ncbi:class I adenylate-forming enzyme family protein [Fodinicurvata sp. EGI_FJ10296]|uniref:class I adenylate-forming enzyme family protein n=1 Tax=Fodinicurvata sp. EGI_FJ10296 TaxID=3231908 RepID=UPI0034526D58
MDAGFLTRRFEGALPAVDSARPALSFDLDETLSHDSLAKRSSRIGNALLARGVKPGDRVGILLYNCIDYIPLYLAIMRVGAIAVRLNFRLAEDELAFALADSGCMMLVFHDDFTQSLDNIRDGLPVRWYVRIPRSSDQAAPFSVSWLEFLSDASDDPPVCARPQGASPAMLMYTSGTTGRPKGALWTHDNVLWFGAIQAIKWRYDPDTVAMTTGPMYHVGAIEDLLSAALAVGGHAVCLRSGAFNIRHVLAVATAHKVTDLMLFPYMVYDLVRDPDFESLDLSTVRRIVSGGDPVLPWAIEALATHHPHIEFVQIYGLTEGSPIGACSTGAESRAHSDSVGRPMPFTEISIRDDEGVALKSGAEGEIWIRGPAVASGYWHRPEATAETFVDSWCRTGDLGRATDDGLLVVSGRTKDMIRSGGENIYPREVEDVLARHPGVREAAVIAVPDSKFLEAVCAVVVPADPSAPPDADDLIRHVRSLLAGYKKPRHLVFTDRIPRTPSGKIQKYRLREQYRHLGAEPDAPTYTAPRQDKRS